MGQAFHLTTLGPAFPPHDATQTQPPDQSSSAIPYISNERFDKTMAKIKFLQDKMEEDEAKRAEEH